MKKEPKLQNEAQEVIRINLKMNVLDGIIDNCDVLYGYSLGASLCATNGRENKYQESFELADAFADELQVLFEMIEDNPEESVTIEIETENFMIDMIACDGLNDLDIFCTKIPQEEE